MRTCAAATRWMGRGGYVGPKRGRGGEEAVHGTGGRAAGWSEKIAGAPRRRRRRRRHRRGRGRRSRGRHSLPCAGARRAHGRALLTAASAAGAAATPPAAVAAAPTRRARVLREGTRPRRPQRIQRRHDPLFEKSKTDVSHRARRARFWPTTAELRHHGRSSPRSPAPTTP